MGEPTETITESDLSVRPTIFLVLDEDGDVKFTTNTEDMSLFIAMSMLDIAKNKMLMTHMHMVQASKKEAERNRPNIIVPELQLAPKRK